MELFHIPLRMQLNSTYPYVGAVSVHLETVCNDPLQTSSVEHLSSLYKPTLAELPTGQPERYFGMETGESSANLDRQQRGQSGFAFEPTTLKYRTWP